MLKFNKKTEYAILALEHMARKTAHGEGMSNTREISETCHIPLPLLAKVMQRLAARGVLRAVHGTKGGYKLAHKPGDLSVLRIIQVFDGPVAVADCLKAEKITCAQWDGCRIRDPFQELNQLIHDLLENTSIADLMNGEGHSFREAGARLYGDAFTLPSLS